MNMKQIAEGTLALILIGLSASAWPAEKVDTWEKIVFHVDDTANARWTMLLANAYLDDSPQAKIVVVSYGPGIDFLLEDAEDRRGKLVQRK